VFDCYSKWERTKVSTKKNPNDIHVHLQMIQDVISRMARCSFQLKQWSIVVFAAILTFSITMPEDGVSYPYTDFLLGVLITSPFIGFGLLDAFYLNQERAYRKLFNQVRMQKTTDFNMVGCVSKVSYWSSVFSVTIIWFYLVEGVFLFLVFLLK